MQTTPSTTTSIQQKIIQAAWQIAREQRFETIQMQNIAEQAGIGRATLYRYYQSKEQIYAEVTYSWGMQFFQRLTSALAPPMEVRARIRWVLQAILQEAESDPNLIHAFLSCILTDTGNAKPEFAAVNTLMPTLLSLALNQPADTIPAQAVRILQYTLLAGLITFQRQEVENATLLDDLQHVADLALGLKP